VHDAVRDRLDMPRDLIPRRDRNRRVVVLDDVQLEARRAGVDDENR
jgi:hypothetical protein